MVMTLSGKASMTARTVRGETLAERNGKLMENSLRKPLGSDDYDVSISQQGKKLQALEKGSVVTIQT